MKPLHGTSGYQLSSGREIHIAMDIIGIGPEYGDGPLTLHSGYDSAEGDWDFTPAERREVAAFAIKRWRKWAASREPR